MVHAEMIIAAAAAVPFGSPHDQISSVVAHLQHGALPQLAIGLQVPSAVALIANAKPKLQHTDEAHAVRARVHARSRPANQG